jgi:hypothetical protein
MSMRHPGMRHLAGLAPFGGAFALATCSSVSGQDGSSSASPSTDAGGPESSSADHAPYSAKDSVQVTATKHLQQATYALDAKASCSILDLEAQNGGDWEPSSQARRGLKRAAMPEKIEPGAAYSATIRADVVPSSDAELPGGGYRLTLAYGTPPTDMASAATIVNSALLTITGGPLDGGGGAPGATPASSPPARQVTPSASVAGRQAWSKQRARAS